LTKTGPKNQETGIALLIGSLYSMRVTPSPQQESAGAAVVRTDTMASESGLDAALTARLFVVVSVVLFLLGALLVFNLWFQHANYQTAITIAEKEQPPSHDHIVSYARAWDFAVVKTSSLFASFLLVFVGALYVLRAGQSSFSLKVAGTGTSGALESSSPGLVMIALGVALAVLTLYKETTIRTTTTTTTAAPSAGLPQPDR
jgi:hypothetical protein